MLANQGDRSAEPKRRRFLTIEDLAEEIGVSKHTLYKWRVRGTFPEARRMPNGRIVVRREDLDDWIEDLPEA